MPNRSKRSQASKARRMKQNQQSENESKNQKSNTQNQPEQSEIRFTYLNRISGNFHQGHSMFSEDSRGRQCSCNSLIMLCRIPNIFNQLDKKQLDQILIDGDYLYRMTSQYLNNLGEMHGSDCLETTQLPKLVALLDGSMYEISYKPLIYCILERKANNDLRSLYEELQVAFTTSNSIILVLGGYMMAIYRDQTTGYYVFFDSHSRDEFGFPSPNGTSVALLFEDFENAHIYLNTLCHKLNVTSQIFGIQPIETQSANRHHVQTQQTCLNATDDLYNKPESASSFNNSPNFKKTSDVPLQRLSRYQKWYQSLSDEQRTRFLERKRQKSNKEYKLQEVAELKRQRSRESYTIPEKAAKKRQQSSESYKIPEKAAKKKHQARQQSSESYKIPEKAAKKKHQARQQSSESYKIPEKAAKKKHQARQQSSESYKIPEKAAKKKHQARQQSSESYKIPEKAAKKRHQARQQSSESYKIPEKAAKKRNQARQQSRESYAIPEKAARKRQQNQSNRYKNKSNIDAVIANFHKSCKEEQQLVYTCQICQRIFFKKQVLKLQIRKYSQSILNQSSACDIKQLMDLCQSQPIWICHTCHQDLLKDRVPKLANVNKLKLAHQPQVLSELNMLERHLVSPAILFMKMIPLIKGAQKGIYGQVVCVKSNIHTTAACLPRLPTEQSLIRVKLKRKLAYKGHHMCQDVNPDKIKRALAWLKANNPVFENISIDFEEFDSMLDDDLIHNEQDDNQEILINDDLEDSGSNHTEIYQFPSEEPLHLELTDDDEHENVVCISQNISISENDEYDDTPTPPAVNETNQIESDNNNNESELESNNGNATVSDNDEDYVTNTSAPLYSFLHPVDFAQYAADKYDESLLCIAPGEGNAPQIVLDMEAKCFPVEFPTASNTFKESREYKLSPSRYFNARMFSADTRFVRNPEYIFFALYSTEVQQIHDNISIALRRGKTRTTDGREITASMLRNHEEVRNLIRRDEGYRFLAKIRGTPAYWEKAKKDVFAMLRQLGIPTFFITFSAADRRWVDLSNSLLILQGKEPMTDEQHKNMSWEDHCKLIMSNPAAAARMFQEKFNCLINNVLLSPAKPIGEIEDYYYRIEFQQRGWPHVHMVVWIKNAPVFNEDSDEQISEFIDRYISCKFPSDDDPELQEIVSNVQMHTKRHTKSCRKTGKVCRFNFPKPPSNRTFISRHADREPSEDDSDEDESLQQSANAERKATEKLREIWEALESDEFTDFNQILGSIGTTQSEFERYLSIVAKRHTVYNERRIEDQWVNNYNPDLIRCWNGNMDIQYVLDPFAATVYMLSYLTKSEREMGDLLRNAQREAREGNVDALSELKKLGSVYLQHREISVMNAIYLICSMPLKQSSRNVVFVQTDADGQKISLPLRQLQENAGKSEDVWMKTQIDKYIDRPSTAKYSNMCMAKFYSTHYQVSGKSYKPSNDQRNAHADDESSDSEDGIDDISSQNSVKRKRQNKEPIKLSNCSVRMKERTKGKPAVIRYPRVSIKRDKERYHMNMLRLYLPHTRKEIKPESYDTYESYHLNGNVTINGETKAVSEIVKENMAEFEPSDDSLDAAWDALQEIPDLEDAWNVLNPQTEQQNLDNKLDNNDRQIDSDDELTDVEIPEFNRENQRNNVARCAIESCTPEITEQQAESLMRQLNDKQRQLFNHVTKWCDEKARNHSLPPFQIFLTGGAGTGKSHVIKCITYYARKAFASMTESADDITVLLLAHTGTAAFNISGETICSALKVPAKASYHYTPLGEESLNPLRLKYRHLQLVIIDEISMVSVPQFDYVHGRLQQIKGTSDTGYFGNVSILAVGDFYQLPPIRPPTPLCFPRDEVLKDLWNHLFQIVELTQIMRQRDDEVFAKMLNRLRTKKQKEPIDEADKKLLISRTVSEEQGLHAPNDALHLFFRNDDVNNHNSQQLESLNTEIYNIQAIDIDQRGGRIIKLHDKPHKTTRKDDTTLADEVNLAIAARVMLISNVDVSDGLCNGVSGTVKGIVFSNNRNMPTVVYVKFDSPRIGFKTRATEFIPQEYDQCTPIKPRKESFQLKGRTFTTTREQIPLKLAWAVTIHKIQGQTTDQAVISMKYLQKAMAYVALSRVTHLTGMYLMDFEESRIFCDENIQANIENMPLCDLSPANPVSNCDHTKQFIIVHHNIQSLRRHLEDLKVNPEMRKAHCICLTETWLDGTSDMGLYSIDGYSLEVVNAGKGRGVAFYIQNSIKYNLVPLPSVTSDCIAIRTSGKTNMLIAVIYKPICIDTRTFNSEMNDLTSQIEILDTDYKILLGDFNRNLIKDQILPAFRQYNQVIEEPTTSNNTLLDHVYIKPRPQTYTAGVLTTYYSYHRPTFIAIKY